MKLKKKKPWAKQIKTDLKNQLGLLYAKHKALKLQNWKLFDKNKYDWLGDKPHPNGDVAILHTF